MKIQTKGILYLYCKEEPGIREFGYIKIHQVASKAPACGRLIIGDCKSSTAS
jgi:hypothetical protein